MRFTSLVVELIRARPRLVVWVVVLVQAAIWLLLPLIFYGSPPGNLATVLAFGREYQVGTDMGPPLAFWLADIAFRAAGNHVFGVYLLAQVCEIATFIAFYQLARAIVGGDATERAISAASAPGLVQVMRWLGVSAKASSFAVSPGLKRRFSSRARSASRP